MGMKKTKKLIPESNMVYGIMSIYSNNFSIPKIRRRSEERKIAFFSSSPLPFINPYMIKKIIASIYTAIVNGEPVHTPVPIPRMTAPNVMNTYFLFDSKSNPFNIRINATIRNMVMNPSPL